MTALLLSLLLSAPPAPPLCTTGPRARVQGRWRRPCASQGTKCDTLSCCPKLTCVEEIVGKVCRPKPEKQKP